MTNNMISQLAKAKLPGNTEEEQLVYFNRIKDVLTRIGVATKDNVLIQSVHILQKRGEYFILHFKQLFGMDGRECNMTDEDTQRLSRIISLLLEWGLVEVISNFQHPENLEPMSRVRIVRRSDVFRGSLSEEVPDGMFRLKRKYAIGSKKSNFNPSV
jgi:hypothetical protein